MKYSPLKSQTSLEGTKKALVPVQREESTAE